VIDGPLRFHVRPALRDAALLIALEGWNDAGEAATTAVRFVANELGAAPLAEIDAEAYFDFTVRRPFTVVGCWVSRTTTRRTTTRLVRSSSVRASRTGIARSLKVTCKPSRPRVDRYFLGTLHDAHFEQ
jgi:hypothetical protein